MSIINQVIITSIAHLVCVVATAKPSTTKYLMIQHCDFSVLIAHVPRDHIRNHKIFVANAKGNLCPEKQVAELKVFHMRYGIFFCWNWRNGNPRGSVTEAHPSNPGEVGIYRDLVRTDRHTDGRTFSNLQQFLLFCKLFYLRRLFKTLFRHNSAEAMSKIARVEVSSTTNPVLFHFILFFY